MDRGEKTERHVYCHYVRRLVPMGHARTSCPRCGATVNDGGTHPVVHLPVKEGKATA
ncbi:MAG TPA: hypothetical protein VIW64_12670 [Pyrinomonadaceae bacterium]|jgi:hypothetical protein